MATFDERDLKFVIVSATQWIERIHHAQALRWIGRDCYGCRIFDHRRRKLCLPMY
jgi:hypothetical protein